MQELLKIRDRIQGEYEDAIDRMDVYNEADGLQAALRIIDERIEQIRQALAQNIGGRPPATEEAASRSQRSRDENAPDKEADR